MSEAPVQQSPQPSGKASLKDGKEKCPLSGAANVVLKPKDGEAIEIPINVKLKSSKGSYTATADKGTAVFPEVVPDTYTIKLELADDSNYISSGAPKSVQVQKQQTATAEQPLRKKPWVGWKVVNLDDGAKDVANVKFKVSIPPKNEGDPAEVVERRPAGEQNVAKVEKLRGEHIELLEADTDVVLVFESVESA